jgi:pimeloyl-ACP methyl ester carboxylesterase
MQLSAIDIPGGVRLHYLEEGHGDTVVLLHGGMGDCWSWPLQMAALTRRFRVLAYSRRYNFPNKNAVVDCAYSCRIDAHDLNQLLNGLSCRRAHLVGTSYGALTALHYALRRPEAVSSLTLVEPPVLGWVEELDGGAEATQAFLGGVWRAAGFSFKQGESRAAMRRLCDGMRGAGHFELLSDEAVSCLMRNSLAMEKLVLSTDPFPELLPSEASRLKVPVLLVTGQETVALHRLCHIAASKVLFGARQAIIPRAGHAPASENPTDFNQVLAALLAIA